MSSWRNILVLCVLSTFCTGCANIWHELQPHRIRRLNRGAAPTVGPEFTWWKSADTSRLARLEKLHPAVVTANTADVTVARGQTAE
jgi:hypothetical protein